MAASSSMAERDLVGPALLASALALASALPVLCLAQGKAPPVAERPAPGIDAGFMNSAIELELSEVELGNIAMQRGANENVREFAQRMVKDHDKAKNELTKLAAQKSQSLPTETTDAHRRLRERLAKLSGSDFDRVYMEAMVRDHEEAVALFRREAQQGHASDVKEWADKQVKMLKAHLRDAKNINARLKVGKTPGS
jgi:putative membrane protein